MPYRSKGYGLWLWSSGKIVVHSLAFLLKNSGYRVLMNLLICRLAVGVDKI